MPRMSDFLARLTSAPIDEPVVFDSQIGLTVTVIEKAGDIWCRAEVPGIEPVLSRDPITAVSRATQAAICGQIAV